MRFFYACRLPDHFENSFPYLAVKSDLKSLIRFVLLSMRVCESPTGNTQPTVVAIPEETR